MARRSLIAAWMMTGLFVGSTANAQEVEATTDATTAGAESGDFAFEGDALGDDLSAEAAYIPPARQHEATSPEIEQGVAAFAARDYQSASGLFYGAMLAAEPGTALAQRAQYELMRTLAEMGMLYGARLIVDEIIAEGEAHPYFQDAASVMITVARRLPGDGEVLDRISAFAPLFPDRIDPKYRDDFAYLLGQHYYGVGELDAAVDYFSVVSPTSTQHVASLFMAAITHVRRYDAAAAAESLKSVMRIVETARGSQRDRLAPIGELARLTMARMYYSTGEYDKSIEYYAGIKQRSEHWLDALFESSWAYFQADEYNRALGNLHSLNSPFFNDEYYPEAPVLQAVIFFYNCQFEQVRFALDEFQYIYAPLKDELRITIDSFFTDAQAYEFLRNAQARRGSNRSFDPRLQQIVDAVLTDAVLEKQLAFVAQLEAEVEFIDKAPAAWSKSELGDFLYSETVGQLALSRDGAGALVRERLAAVHAELEQKERESSAILVETDLAEANALSSTVASEMASSAAVDTKDVVHREQMLWRFDGEYWRDELGYYSYHISSKCQAGGTN